MDEELAKQVASLDANSCDVRLLGHIRDMAKFYSAIDILLIPSYSEGSPRVLIEAMSAGVSVVCTDVGAMPWILRRAGILDETVCQVDCKSMSSTLKRQVINPELRTRIGRGLREEYERYYTIESMCNDTLRIYNAIW